MQAFATAAEYRDKYSTDMDDGKLSEWLADASDIMMAEMDSAGVDYSNPDAKLTSRLLRVCRDMVHRAIGDGTDSAASIPFGATQASMAAGGYSESFTIGNPYGDLYLKDRERKSLGIKAIGFAVAVPSYGNAEVHDD